MSENTCRDCSQRWKKSLLSSLWVQEWSDRTSKKIWRLFTKVRGITVILIVSTRVVRNATWKHTTVFCSTHFREGFVTIFSEIQSVPTNLQRVPTWRAEKRLITTQELWTRDVLMSKNVQETEYHLHITELKHACNLQSFPTCTFEIFFLCSYLK